MVLSCEDLRRLSLQNERCYPGARGLNCFAQQHLVAYEFVQQFIDAHSVVLDIGSGAGYGTSCLSKSAKSVIGIDYSQEAIAYSSSSHRRQNAEYIVMDACNLAFQDRIFDIVCSIQVIEHLHEVETFLNEARRVLRRGGILVLATPNKATFSPDYSSLSSPLPYHVREWYENELESLLCRYFHTVRLYGSCFNKRSIPVMLYTVALKIIRIMDILKIKVIKESFEKSVFEKMDSQITTDCFRILRNGDYSKALDLVAVCTK